MKLGINRIETYNPVTRKINQSFEFNENGVGRYIIEVVCTDNVHSIIKSMICRDIVNGQLGMKPHIYTWLNRPEKIQNGKSTIKKNYRVL